MFKKALTTAVVAACVMGATSTANAHQVGSVGAGQSDFSFFEWLIGEPIGSDPVTNPPGPRPPPKLDGLDPETNPPGPKPPPR